MKSESQLEGKPCHGLLDDLLATKLEEYDLGEVRDQRAKFHCKTVDGSKDTCART